MLLVCLLSIGFASRAVYERRSTVVVDVKLTAYRARLTTHSDRDETFLAARKHLIEEQGKRKYFYREFPLVFVGSEGDRGDPMRSEKRVRKVRSMMDLMLVERGARYGAIPNSVDWNELIVNAMLDFSEEEEERTKDAYQREENVIKLCELKRAIESSLGYEEACATRDQVLGGYHAGWTFSSKTCAPPWSVFDVNLVYMNVDIWHTAFQTLKGLYVYDDRDGDSNNKTETTTRLLQTAVDICGENDTTSLLKANRLCENDGFACEERGCEERMYENVNESGEMNMIEQPKMCNLIGDLSVCDWIERAKPTTEEIKIISEMPSVEEEIENAFAPCDSETILDQVRRSLRGLRVFISWANKWEAFEVVTRPWEPILDFDTFGFREDEDDEGVTTRYDNISTLSKRKFGATRLIFQRKKSDLYRGISEEDSIRWVKNSFERTIREWSKEYDIESALRFETDETPPSDRVAWRHWQTYSSLELEQLANDCQWIIAAFGACFALVFFHTGSVIVTVVSCIVVASSLVFAIFTYILGLDKVWVGVLHFLGVFCILGIGADDAFVLVDHWKLSAKLVPVPKKTRRDDDEDEDEDNDNEIEKSTRCRMRNTGYSIDAEAWLIDRMSWTIQKSFFSICCTSATTTTAFATLIFSNIEPLRLFGIFAALSVAFCFFVTIAMVPASLILDARLSERKRRFFAIVNAPGGRSSKVVPRRMKVVTAMEGGVGGAGESGEREAKKEVEEKQEKRLERIESDTFPSTSRRSKSYGNEADLFASSFERRISDDTDYDEKEKNMTTKMNTKRNLMDGYFDDDDDDDDDDNVVKQLKSKRYGTNQKHKRAKSFGFFGDGDDASMRTVNGANAARDRQRLDRLKRVLEPINDAFTRVDTARRAALGFAASLSESIGKFAISKRYPVLILSFILAAYEAYVASTLKPPDGSSHSIWPESFNPNVFARQNREYIPYARREEAIQLHFIFGIDPTKTRQSSGFDKTLRFEDTKVAFAEDFNDTNVDVQKWMLDFCELLNNDRRILKPSLKCFTQELDDWSQNFRYPNRVPFANATQYERYVEDFINDATFRAGEKGGLHIPHVISTDACALKNKDAYGFEDENIVLNALESLRIELREICEFLSDEENLALMNTNVRYYNNGTRVINATTTTSIPSSWSDEQLRAFELASQFMIENEEYDLNVTNDGELSASLFPPGGDYYYGTSSTTLPTAKDEENVKHLALACSKLSEENTCKRGIIISASINVSSTASQHDIVNARDDWERWFQQALSTAPDTVRGSAFQTSSAWSYADTVEELAKGAKTALVASFFFAFIVAFFASRSFAIAFATCFSVAFACAASLGLSATFRDWKFGVIESVCVTLLVGLSVDYPLHVASAYAAASSSLKNANDDANVVGERERKEREQDKESLFENTPTSTTMTATKTKTKTTNDLLRASRALQAIRSVGPSVIGGAFTTASAAGFLFAGCVIVFFSTFGAFVIVTLCLSVFSSAFVLVAALAVVGPL